MDENRDVDLKRNSGTVEWKVSSILFYVIDSDFRIIEPTFVFVVCYSAYLTAECVDLSAILGFYANIKSFLECLKHLKLGLYRSVTRGV